MSAFEAVRLVDGGVLWCRLSRLDLQEFWNRGIKGVLSLVILTLLTALTGGALKTFWEINFSSIIRSKLSCARSLSIRSCCWHSPRYSKQPSPTSGGACQGDIYRGYDPGCHADRGHLSMVQRRRLATTNGPLRDSADSRRRSRHGSSMESGTENRA